MRKILAALAVVVVLAGCAPTSPPPPEPLGAKDVGIQLFEWNWDSIAKECTDHLGPAGIAWVLTSPPQEHVAGTQWWTNYQPVSYRIESRLGNREQFAAMVETCSTAGVDIIADAVINHMTGQVAPGVGVAGSPYDHYDYPGLYGPDDFHYCPQIPSGDIGNYKDKAEVQNCELVNLADLKTESPHVRETIAAYLNDLLSLGVAGFRIDAAKHMPAEDLEAIVGMLPEGTRIMHEVIRGAGEPISPEQYVGSGQVFEFSFARDLKNYLEGATLVNGADFGPDFGTLPSEDAIAFVTNHDTERNGQTLAYRDDENFLLATAFMLAQPYGTPVLYSGYAFRSRDTGPESDKKTGLALDVECEEKSVVYGPGEWVCQQRDEAVIRMIEFRSAVGDAPVTDQWNNEWSYAFGRGEYGFAVFNAGEEDLTGTFASSLRAGTYTDAISGEKISVGADGKFRATVHPHSALAISVGAVDR